MFGQYAAQLLGMQAQQACQPQEYYQGGLVAAISTPYSSIPITDGSWGTSNTLYIDDKEAERAGISCGSVEAKQQDPPDEFTQLSNHKFHELLDKFKETT